MRGWIFLIDNLSSLGEVRKHVDPRIYKHFKMDPRIEAPASSKDDNRQGNLIKILGEIQ